MELALKAPFAGTVAAVDAADRATRSRSAPRSSWSSAGREADAVMRTPAGRTCRRRCPSERHDLRGRPARRAAEREGARARPRSRPSSSAGWSPPGCRSSRRPASCTRSGCRSSPTPSELMDARPRRRRPRAAGAGAQRARPRPRARAGRAATSRSSARATETFAQRNLNRSLDEQFAMFEPTVRRARDAGLDVRAYVSMCFGDPWEGDVPVEQVVAVGKRLFDLGASQLSLGDTIGVGTAGHVTALLGGFVDAGMSARPARHALPRHLRPGARQHLRRAASRASRRSTPAPAASAAARTPRAPPATSPPRTWSGCCTASASRPASTSSRSSRPASGWPATSAGPSPSAVVRALGEGVTWRTAQSGA